MDSACDCRGPYSLQKALRRKKDGGDSLDWARSGFRNFQNTFPGEVKSAHDDMFQKRDCYGAQRTLVEARARPYPRFAILNKSWFWTVSSSVNGVQRTSQ